jgi:hypothetical protein
VAGGAGQWPKKQNLKDLFFQPRVLLTALALPLLIPALRHCVLQDQASLEQFHNRKLRPWPSATELMSDPPQYFQHVRQWMSDWAFPIGGLASSEEVAVLYVLNQLPQRRVMMGKNGFIFLNGASDDTLRILESTCVRAHTVETAAAEKCAGFFGKLCGPATIAVDVMVPTSTLYGDFLPTPFPRKYRRHVESGRRAARRCELRQSSPVRLMFPLLEMKELSWTRAFSRKGNWHPDLSLKVIRDAYLRQLGVSAASKRR